MEEQARRLEPAKTLHAIKRFSEAVGELKGGYQPQLPLELALIEAAQGPAVMTQTVVAATPVVMPSGASQAATADAPRTAQPTTGPESPQPASQPVSQTAVESTAVQPVSEEPDAISSSTPPAASPSASAPAQLDHEGAARLGAQWEKVLDQVRARIGHNVRAALRAVRDTVVSTHAVGFAFGNNEFSRDLVAKPEIAKQVAQLISDVLGRQVIIECQMGDTARLFNTRDSTGPGEDATDTLVDFAVNELGAKVVE